MTRGKLLPAAFLLLGLLVMGADAAAQQDAATPPYPDRELALVVYGWGSELVGTVGADGASTDVDASFSDIFDKLNVGAMMVGGARIGRYIASLDVMWLQLEADRGTGTAQLGPITLGPAKIDVDLTQAMVDLKLGYRVLEPRPERPLSIDLLAGGRYWYVRTEIDVDFALLPDRDFDETEKWVDPLIGARLRFALTPSLELTALGDWGGWDLGSASHRTWQALGLVSWKVREGWVISAGYRAMDLDRDLADLQLRGPIIGVGYRF